MISIQNSSHVSSQNPSQNYTLNILVPKKFGHVSERKWNLKLFSKPKLKPNFPIESGPYYPSDLMQNRSKCVKSGCRIMVRPIDIINDSDRMAVATARKAHDR